MLSKTLGLTESVSMALGGMIGGGIYAVLGVVAQLTMYATWAAFVAAGVVAGCTGYSYTKLNEIDDQNQGGSVSFVQSFVGNSTLAGMTGWTLLVGYIGSMAIYHREPNTFYMVLLIAVTVITVELLYFERETIERGVEEFETALLGEDETLPSGAGSE